MLALRTRNPATTLIWNARNDVICDKVTMSVVDQPASNNGCNAAGAASRGWNTSMCICSNAVASRLPNTRRVSGATRWVGPGASSRLSGPAGNEPYGPCPPGAEIAAATGAFSSSEGDEADGRPDIAELLPVERFGALLELIDGVGSGTPGGDGVGSGRGSGNEGSGNGGSPAGLADSQATASYNNYLADPLRVYSPPGYEAPAPYAEPSGTAAYTAAPPPAAGSVPYADGYPAQPYADQAGYQDGYSSGGYAPGYEAGYPGDPYPSEGYGPYPPQG